MEQRIPDRKMQLKHLLAEVQLGSVHRWKHYRRERCICEFLKSTHYIQPLKILKEHFILPLMLCRNLSFNSIHRFASRCNSATYLNESSQSKNFPAILPVMKCLNVLLVEIGKMYTVKLLRSRYEQRNNRSCSNIQQHTVSFWYRREDHFHLIQVPFQKRVASKMKVLFPGRLSGSTFWRILPREVVSFPLR